MYRGYFNTREGKQLVAIKTCKRMFIHVYTRVKQIMLKDIGVIVPKIREQDRFLKRYTHSIRGCSHNMFFQCVLFPPVFNVPYSE